MLARDECPLCRLAIAAVTQDRERVYGDDNPEWLYGIDPSAVVELNSSDDASGAPYLTVNLDHSNRRLCLIEADQGDDADRPGAMILEDLIDCNRINGWIKTCEEDHGDFCAHAINVRDRFRSSSSPGAESMFRVIDVRSGCVVETPPSLRYVALSYVWGNAPSLRLSRHNKSALVREFGLRRHWG